jgi:hypothetical protein
VKQLGFQDIMDRLVIGPGQLAVKDILHTIPAHKTANPMFHVMVKVLSSWVNKAPASDNSCVPEYAIASGSIWCGLECTAPRIYFAIVKWIAGKAFGTANECFGDWIKIEGVDHSPWIDWDT